MSATGVELTFQVLAKTSNPAAVPSLISALDSPHPQIRDFAVRSLLRRKEIEGHRAVLNRFNQLPPELQRVVWEHRVRLGGAIRELLRSGDPQEALLGIQIAVSFREYELVPVLTHMVLAPNRFPAKLAAGAILELAQALREERSESSPKPRVPPLEAIQRQFLHALGRAVERFSSHQCPEILLAYVVLAEPGDPLIARVLENPSHPAHRRLCEILQKAAHPNVVPLLVGLLQQHIVPPVVVRIVARRSDLHFIKAFLSLIGGELPLHTQRHLSQLRTFSWLEQLPTVLPQLSVSEQIALTRLGQICGLRTSETLELLKCLLKWGEPAARKAAVLALEPITGPQGNHLFCQALNDPDPQVQAQAVRQLRKRGMLGALPKLIELLDSSELALRQAAQESLEEFRFDRFAAAFDLLEDDVRHTIGKLVRKADPQACDRLREEMQSASRVRRLRAIALAEAMELVTEREPELIQLADDPDHMVRTAAIKALARCRSESARQAIRRALTDRAIAVQQTAQAILAELEPGNLPESLLPGAIS
jgi:HEAT repeat protein